MTDRLSPLGSNPPPRRQASDVMRLIRVVLALPELGLRVRWLTEALSEPPCRAAPILNGLCERALSGDPRAREALLALGLCVAAQCSWDGPEETPLRRQLRLWAEQNALWALERLLRVGPVGDTGQPAPTELPIPDYGTGRELTLGERRSLARRPTRPQLERLLKDPSPMVLRQLLTCQRLTEADVVGLVSRRPPRRVALASVAGSLRWLSRPRVRMALVLQPTCPLGVSIPLLHTCVRRDLYAVTHDPALPLPLRNAARELFERAPPLGPPAAPLQ